jgi:mono/diheme cytochrome c family protein
MQRRRIILQGGGIMLGLALATTAPATDFARQNYLLHCAGCHLPDGTGSAPNEVPTLHRIPGEFVKVPRGREFLAQVPGIVYSPLSDSEVAEILNWVLMKFNREVLPTDFTQYTAAEVAKYRAIRPASIMKVRAAVLADLAAQGTIIDYTQH